MNLRDLDTLRRTVEEGVQDDVVLRTKEFLVSPDVWKDLKQWAAEHCTYAAVQRSQDSFLGSVRFDGVVVREGVYLPSGTIMMMGRDRNGSPTVLGWLRCWEGGDHVSDLRERLAALVHGQWARRAGQLLDSLEPLLMAEGEENARGDFARKAFDAEARWEYEIDTEYGQLPDAAKAPFREWAGTVLELMEEAT